MLACRPTKSIMVKAGRELTLERVKVFYGNDRSKTLYFDKDLKEDQESGWQSLGSRLCIKRIEVYGNSEGARPGSRYTGANEQRAGEIPAQCLFLGYVPITCCIGCPSASCKHILVFTSLP